MTAKKKEKKKLRLFRLQFSFFLREKSLTKFQLELRSVSLRLFLFPNQIDYQALLLYSYTLKFAVCFFLMKTVLEIILFRFSQDKPGSNQLGLKYEGTYYSKYYCFKFNFLKLMFWISILIHTLAWSKVIYSHLFFYFNSLIYSGSINISKITIYWPNYCQYIDNTIVNILNFLRSLEKNYRYQTGSNDIWESPLNSNKTKCCYQGIKVIWKSCYQYIEHLKVFRRRVRIPNWVGSNIAKCCYQG